MRETQIKRNLLKKPIIVESTTIQTPQPEKSILKKKSIIKKKDTVKSPMVIELNLIRHKLKVYKQALNALMKTLKKYEPILKKLEK